ncbi:MAG: Trm112 family protein [Ilumatobacteraceae bacterium]
MTLDTSLLSILACPEDKGPLYYFAADGFLFNPRLSRKYLVRDGIPVMLIEEAVSVEATERDALMRRISDEGIAPTFTG